MNFAARLPSLLVVLALCGAPPLVLADAAPSAASVARLLDVMQARAMVDDMSGKMDKLMQDSMRAALNGQTLRPEQQKVIDDMRGEMVALLRDQISWEVMEPLMKDIYARTFTQAEVDAMTTFYSTPLGRSVVAKLPQVTTLSMEAMQGRMAALGPRMQEIQARMVQKMRALETPAAQ